MTDQAKPSSKQSEERKTVRNDVAHSTGVANELDVEALQRRLLEQEAELRQLQKMETVSRLAGGIAHDFNNLLTVILGRTDVLLAGLAPDSPLHEGLEEVRKASERAAELTRRLLVFSRKNVYRPRVLDVNALIVDLEKILGRLIGETVQLKLSLDPAVAPVKADPSQLEQVILNLAVNARDAMPQGGTLTLSTAAATFDTTATLPHPDMPLGPYSVLSVRDTGSGMSAEVQARLFEPFFTTKEKGQGTGLGLTTVRGIVQQAGGTIRFGSEIGRGTTFEIYLPALPATVVRPPAQKSAVRSRGGSETILVAEDERQVRDLIATLLKDQGYNVLPAATGREAMALSERHSGAIDLLITDIMMPDVTGPELAERLATVRPEMRVLHMSGYTGSVILRRSALQADVPFLAKPFTAAVLSSKVRRALQHKTSRTGNERPDEKPAG
jgi:two-component system, cell cycle sensor histidine kinase and response regulator CckA